MYEAIASSGGQVWWRAVGGAPLYVPGAANIGDKVFVGNTLVFIVSVLQSGAKFLRKVSDLREIAA